MRFGVVALCSTLAIWAQPRLHDQTLARSVRASYPAVAFVDRGYLRPSTELGSYQQLWYAPLPLTPMVSGNQVLPWDPQGDEGAGGSAVFSTTLTPQLDAPPIAIAWINQQQASAQIYAGTTQPGGTWPYQAPVAPSRYATLLAAFEGGFQFTHGGGGFYQGGRYGAPLQNGDASLVEYDNGTMAIGAWGTEIGMTSSVEAVRQNLTLLVDHGQVTPQASIAPLVNWGYSLGNLVNTWRSGIGITANNNLVWVGGPGLSPAELGAVLVHAGAVEGMQLDINPDWVNFATYTDPGPNGIVGTNLLSAMIFPPVHYLGPFWRDFVAVFLRS
ncbi:hypothetical protein [Ferrimicrobium sp.]|uniref:hypothetical protein n=1 Tax=Ferrimicrobium sp. TaxID=2926050 RepID=UPI002637CD56|nr:hypothetical protein [Ferrimicrobium sp.]